MSENVFEDREIYQPENDPPVKPRVRRFRGIRFRLLFEPKSKGITHSPCKAKGCSGSATHGKPFCIEHMDRLPYIKAMKANLQKAS